MYFEKGTKIFSSWVQEIPPGTPPASSFLFARRLLGVPSASLGNAVTDAEATPLLFPLPTALQQHLAALCPVPTNGEAGKASPWFAHPRHTFFIIAQSLRHRCQLPKQWPLERPPL